MLLWKFLVLIVLPAAANGCVNASNPKFFRKKPAKLDEKPTDTSKTRMLSTSALRTMISWKVFVLVVLVATTNAIP
ncbi:unnamed protein product [Cylicocyclus nassatus]|uniref:Secreted protein n=1 Tax=Cylicocyclus nassatus TaxID=53992 RepID=A0AA36GR98_CYLNA|nr:unnamed protein product [Cylicocyclus nassatus]